jgi:hypothetical protein
MKDFINSKIKFREGSAHLRLVGWQGQKSRQPNRILSAMQSDSQPRHINLKGEGNDIES